MELNAVDVAIGQRIKQLREAKNLSVDNVCERMRVTPQTVAAWENGKLHLQPSEFYRLAANLHVPISSFFEWRGERLVVASSE